LHNTFMTQSMAGPQGGPIGITRVRNPDSASGQMEENVLHRAAASLVSFSARAGTYTLEGRQ